MKKDELSELLEKMGAFFAFGNKQFEEQKKDGVIYSSLGGGLIAPQENVKALIKGIDEIQKSKIKNDLSKNSVKEIISRELSNFECFYSGDIQDCVDALEGYGISYEEVESMYIHMLRNEDVGL